MGKEYDRKDLVIEPDYTRFRGSDESEPIVCAWFGCRVHLSLEELRFGKFCCKHNTRLKFDVTKFINY